MRVSSPGYHAGIIARVCRYHAGIIARVCGYHAGIIARVSSPGYHADIMRVSSPGYHAGIASWPGPTPAWSPPASPRHRC
eukprot:606198-Pyramimonas_sp.AAC.1